MRRGIYRESLSIRHGGKPRRPITLRSYPGEGARLVGLLTIARPASYVVLKRLYIDGANPRRSPSPQVTTHHVTFWNNNVTNDHTAICFLLGYRGYGRAQQVVISRNRIHDCGQLPATGLEHGIYVEKSNDVLISGNWIYDNADYGVHLYPDAQGTRVTGNVIDGNGMGVVFAGEGPFASNNNVVERNVISNSTRRHNVDSFFPGSVGRGNVLRRNCVGGGARDNGDGGIETPHLGFQAVGNRIATPRFPRRAKKSFRLSRRSPCSAYLPKTRGTPGVGAAPPPATFVQVLRAPRRIRRGGRLRVRGAVVRDGNGHPPSASLQVRRRSRWLTLATAPVGGEGRFRLAHRVARSRGRLTLRVTAPAARPSKAFRVRVG